MHSTLFLPIYNMSSSSEVLPYSVSSGSAYSTFEKLQGSKNYATWKNCMHTVLITLSQWEVVTGAIVAPTPVASNKMTTEEVKENKAWIVCKTSAFMEISFCIADSTLSVLDDINDPCNETNPIFRLYAFFQSFCISYRLSLCYHVIVRLMSCSPNSHHTPAHMTKSSFT